MVDDDLLRTLQSYISSSASPPLSPPPVAKGGDSDIIQALQGFIAGQTAGTPGASGVHQRTRELRDQLLGNNARGDGLILRLQEAAERGADIGESLISALFVHGKHADEILGNVNSLREDGGADALAELMPLLDHQRSNITIISDLLKVLIPATDDLAPERKPIPPAPRSTRLGLSMRCLNCRHSDLPDGTDICPECGVYLPSLFRELLPPGTQLHGGRYRLQHALGRGGFGVTYRGTHVGLDAPVAIKEFFPQAYAARYAATLHLTVPGPQHDAFQKGLERFTREGKILAGLHHPGIVDVSDLFQENGTAYLVMDLVGGQTLEELLAARPDRRLPEDQVRDIVNQVVDALATVHASTIYHLDLKPDNILVTDSGQVVLIDFGAARRGGSRHSTQAFAFEYAAPEVISGGDVGPASDLFGLGMVTHELLTGTRPPPALSRILGDAWAPGDLGDPWTRLLARALEIRREDRPPTVTSWWATVSRGGRR